MNSLKTFRGDSFQDGLQKVYAEFGERAKILHSREVVESSWFGFRKIRFVEITAAKPDIESESKSKFESEIKSKVELGSNFQNENLKSEISDNRVESIFFETNNRRLSKNDLGSVKLRNDEFINNNNNDADKSNNSYKSKSNDNREEVSGRGSRLLKLSGVVSLGGWRRMELGDFNPTLLQRNLLMMFEEIVRFGGPIDLSSGRRVVAALVGATGVGKTSTIAKIAAFYKLRENRKVGLLTTDVFRIAAADQLQRYAEMLGIPFETASDANRIQTSLRRLIGCELVLIDTPGMNPLNESRLRGISSVLLEAGADEVHLLLSATSSLSALLDTINRFSIMGLTGLTLTKLDEAVGISDVYKMLKLNSLPLRFFTFGQNISEDIEVAGAARLASLYQQPTTEGNF